MRSCAQARRLFGPYWDDETTQAEREWLDHHFQVCPGCRTEYESFSRTAELIGSLPRHEASPGLPERALAVARRASPAPDRLVPVESARRWLPMTAAAALLVLVGAMVAQWIPPTRDARTMASRAPEPVLQATRVAAPAARPSTTPGTDGTAARETVADGAVAALPDSLFDHSEDVEFILDPVTLRRGRAHTLSRLPRGVQGEQAVITF